MSILLTRHIAYKKGTAVTSTWILATGVWNYSGFWKDDELWKYS